VSFFSGRGRKAEQAALTASFDIAHATVRISMAEGYQRALAETGGPPIGMATQFGRLAFGPGKISFKEFILYRLFDDAWLAGADKGEFVGERSRRALILRINYRHEWYGLLENKLTSQSYLAAYGLPTISARAIYAPGLTIPSDRILCLSDDLRRFLLAEGNYPLFGKPVESVQSLGALGLFGCDAARGELITVGDKRLKIDTVIEDIHKHYAAGYLFQSMLRPRRDLIPVIGERLATARILTIATPLGPKVHRACWKLPAANNPADNFWREGNMLASLDLETGRIRRVTSGVGFEMRDLERHPDTGAELIGIAIPDWDRMKAVAVEGAKVLRHFGIIGWDIAATDDGPIIVEANYNPDFNLVQIADRRGVLCKEFNDLVAYQKAARADYVKQIKKELAQL
jgi:hypothetical protein